MTEHAPDRIWSGIDIPKTIAGVLAAVSAAVVGSFLGVAGTLVGAAVASLIGSVGTEIYHRSIDRGRKKIEGTFLAPAAVGTPPVEAAAEEKPSSPAPTPRKVRWGRVAMVAGALFVLAMGTLTVAEMFAGRSIADATRGGAGDSTTLTSLFTDKSGKSEKSTPTPVESATPSDQATTGPDQPSQQTSTDPSSPQPTDTSTQIPTTAPTGGGTTDPGTGTDSTGTDSGNGSDSGGSGSGGSGSGDLAPDNTQKSDTQGTE